MAKKKSNNIFSVLNSRTIEINQINELKRCISELKISEEKCHNLINSFYDGVMLVRSDSTIEFVNSQLEKMFGYDSGELLNKKLDILILEKDREKHQKHKKDYFFKPVQREMCKGFNIYGRCKDGSEVPLAISLSPILINSDLRVSCTIRNITEQKRLEEVFNKLLKQEKIRRDESEKENHIKDEFLATLSHELRTPLTAILGWAQELRSESADQKSISEGLAIIERSARAQGQLINDLLDIARINSGKLAVDLQEIDLIEALNMAIDSVRKLAEKKSINIEIDLATPVCEVFADAVRMQQVFWNLLTNAVKFTPQHGNIFIKLKVIGTPDDKQTGRLAQIQIIDTGLGIKPEFVSQIFQRFCQADRSTTRNYGGMGLGLAIVRNLVEMQNGTVTVESNGEGQGAAFTVTLPLLTITKNKTTSEIRTTTIPNEIQKRLDGLKILAVDDNIDNRVLFSIILKSLGAKVKLAESAAEALKILNGYRPDIIISDISMPTEDGYSLLRKIRQRELGKDQQIPVIALTAHAGIEDARHMLEAGFSAHVAKPVDRKTLASTILKLTTKPQA